MTSSAWADLLAMEQVVARRDVPARPAQVAPLPDTLHPELAAALRAAGVEQLYSHQSEAFAAAALGNIAIVTGTASGKSLGFNLPVLDAVAGDRRACALYLYPTKALAHDQARSMAGLRPPGLRLAMYDGDTPPAQRRQAREWANVVLTNPDMLHVGLLPAHAAWADLLANLRFVVVDEAHAYRGVFGSHVANVLARLRRVCAAYGSRPRFLLASATVANPGPAAEVLAGGPVTLIEQDGSPAAERELAVWNPPLLDEALGIRASALGEAAALFAGLVARDVRTIAFAKSRRGCELMYRYAREALERHAPQAAAAIAPYRAGYTPEQRREIEQGLAGGRLLGVVATSALELGVDVGHLDCAVSVGFPGSMASLRQQWGRAGRRRAGLGVMVAGDDALDQYFARHPDELLARPVEAAVANPGNPAVLSGHLLAAAAERPLVPADEQHFGRGALALAAELSDLAPTRAGFVFRGLDHPAGRISLRSTGAGAVAVVDAATGALCGLVDVARAPSTVHPGAVYLHQGERLLVRELDLEGRVAVVEPFAGDYYTQPKTVSAVTVQAEHAAREQAGICLTLGGVEMREQVVGFQRRRLADHTPIDLTELELPAHTYSTEAVWFSPAVPDGEPLLGSLHAAEHAMISLLPLLATCDRGDIGGLSTSHHMHTGLPTVFVYDGHPGGVGIAARGFELFERWTATTAELLRACPCARGCPSCVQSPKCGDLNHPLSKKGALRTLELLAAAAADPSRRGEANRARRPASLSRATKKTPQPRNR
ncbi:MAG: DEAD/DEAH box helicase [Gaiellales bacterium]